MGLFSKKPKSIIVQKPATGAASDVDPMDGLEDLLPKVDDSAQACSTGQARPSAEVAKPMKPPKPARKNKKATVDLVDFLALRAELVDMRARLDESEQARAIVEARLSSLDATAAAFGNERNDISEVANMVLQLQQQIAERPVAAGGGDTAISTGAHDELSAKVDALQNRLFGLQDHAPKIAEFEAQLAQLSQRTGDRNCGGSRGRRPAPATAQRQRARPRDSRTNRRGAATRSTSSTRSAIASARSIISSFASASSTSSKSG